MLISLIALLLVVGGILGFILYNNYQIVLNNLAATATARAQATALVYARATAQANAYATAQVNARATVTAQAPIFANAQATVAAIKSHYPYSSHLVLNDPLTSSSHADQYGWDQGSSPYENGTCAFTSRGYEVTTNQVRDCMAQKTSFSDFTFEIHMAITVANGSFTSGCVIFRTGYYFFLSSEGFYDLLGNGSNSLGFGFIAASTVSTISVVARGSQISILVDQQPVIQVNDGGYDNGEIGVLAGADYNGGGSVTIDYTNAKVWQI